MNEEKVIRMTIQELGALLQEQKRITIERLRGSSSYYNAESTASCSKALPIDEERFLETGMKSSFPRDYEVLKKYI